MNLIKNILPLMLVFSFQLTFSQTEKIKQDSILPEDVISEEREMPAPKRKPTKRPQSYEHSYEYYGNSSDGIYLKHTAVNSVTKELKLSTIDSIVWKSPPTEINIIEFKDGFDVFKPIGKYSVEQNSIKNYITYKHKKKYGVVLNNHIIPAKYDTIGQPVLVKGKTPYILVGIRKKRKLKWGIIDAEGLPVIPVEYDHIDIPIPTDLSHAAFSWNDPDYERRLLLKNFDGLYQNQKIIVQKKDKYGLYNAIGEQLLETIYDTITASKFLDFYTIKENDKYGFLIVIQNEISRTGIPVPSKQENKDVILFPKLDFPIFKEQKINGSYYSVSSDGTKQTIKKSKILELLDN